MTAIILAGGKGTRLRPFTVTIPKPLLPLGDIPIVEVIIEQLAAAGVSRIVFSLGHMPHLFKALLDDRKKFGVELDYCLEDEPLGTAGALRQIPNLPENFLVMNGDLLTTIDYRALFDFHVHHRAWGTIALHQREVKIDYGVIQTKPDGALADYVEKPTIPYDVSMGINVLSRHSLDLLPDDGKFDMPDLMTAIATAGEKVMCYRTDCYWQDIGRFDDYERASADFVASPSTFVPTVNLVKQAA